MMIRFINFLGFYLFVSVSLWICFCEVLVKRRPFVFVSVELVEKKLCYSDCMSSVLTCLHKGYQNMCAKRNDFQQKKIVCVDIKRKLKN